MELKIGEYTIPEGCTIKRTGNIIQVYKKKQVDTSILRCRDCRHCEPNPLWNRQYQCAARTWGKTYKRHYTISLYKKACDKIELKDSQE